MNRRSHVDGFGLAAGVLPLIVAFALAVVPQPAQAASLVRVTNFGTNPTGLNMYLYAPDRVAARPAQLVMVHYCGGSAAAVHNGNERDYVTAADRLGYVIVYPEATRDGRCFDVSTANALRRNGGGDSTGIMAMVAQARQRYNVDPERIVVSGFSSGAMMTNVLAAQYPDVFSAAAAYSGVPAGCFATTNGSPRNSQCSGGNLLKSPQQWGDQARAMYPVSRTPSSTEQPQPSWTRTRTRYCWQLRFTLPGGQAMHTGDSTPAGGFTLNDARCAVG